MKKKIALVVTSAVLLCALIAMGTVAYLTAKSNGGTAVVNTFTSAGLIIPPSQTDDGFHIYETNPEYALDPSKAPTTLSRSYTVIPGVALEKDPYVLIQGKTETASYLFVEIVENEGLTGIDFNSGLTYAATSDWTKLEGVTGAKGGTVYAYKKTISSADNNYDVVTTDSVDNDSIKLSILKDNKINVDDAYVATKNAGVAVSDTLSFYGYLCQAGSFEVDAAVSTRNTYAKAAAVAYTTCFGA